MYSGLRRARSMRMPEATSACFTPGCRRAAFKQSHQRPVIGGQQRADRRVQAAQPPALLAHLRPRAVHLVHVGRRAAEVADRAREIGLARPCGGSRRGSTASLRLWMMRPSWAVIEQNVQPPKQPRMIWIESFTTSKAGIRCSAVARVRPPRERQAVDAIHLLLRKRPGGRIDDHRLAPVILHQPPGVVRDSSPRGSSASWRRRRPCRSRLLRSWEGRGIGMMRDE